MHPDNHADRQRERQTSCRDYNDQIKTRLKQSEMSQSPVSARISATSLRTERKLIQKFCANNCTRLIPAVRNPPKRNHDLRKDAAPLLQVAGLGYAVKPERTYEEVDF